MIIQQFMLRSVKENYFTITRKDNKNAVIMSEEMYNNLMENIYIMSNKNNYYWLMESKRQLEKGMASIRNLINTDEE